MKRAPSTESWESTSDSGAEAEVPSVNVTWMPDEGAWNHVRAAPRWGHNAKIKDHWRGQLICISSTEKLTANSHQSHFTAVCEKQHTWQVHSEVFFPHWFSVITVPACYCWVVVSPVPVGQWEHLHQDADLCYSGYSDIGGQLLTKTVNRHIVHLTARHADSSWFQIASHNRDVTQQS